MNASTALDPASQRVAVSLPEPVLHLTLLGPFSATFDGVPLRFTTRKAKAVLAYVAMGDSTGEPRERLLGLLWSESATAKAQGSLRHAVKEVNDVLRAAGFSGFHAAKQVLALDATKVVTDVGNVVSATNSGIAHERLLETSRLADTLLSDLEPLDPQFQAWVRTKRYALHDRLTAALERALPAEIGDGASVDLGQALLSLDPTNEVACRHVIHARVARGEIGGALKAYKALWDELDNEFDTEPSPETQDLIVRIKQGGGWSTRPGAAVVEDMPVAAIGLAAPDAPPPLRKLFIVVQNFDVEGVPAKSRYVINGFRHELVATLARFREWSVRAEKSKPEPVRDGVERGTEYTLAMTAFGGPGGFRLVATMENDEFDVVWSQPFNLRLSDFMSSQQEIVRQIAKALNVNLSADRLRRVSSDTNLDADLHATWLHGQSLLQNLSPQDWHASQQIFQSLIERVPTFSPAHSSLVQIKNSKHIVFPGVFRSKPDHIEALGLAQRAVQLDPLDSRAQLCLAWAYQLLGQRPQATLHAELAIDLNANDLWTLMGAAQIFAYCGHYEKAIQLCAQSLASSQMPTPTQRSYAAAIHFLAGRYDECLAFSAGGLERAPGFSIWNCAAQARMGRISEARATLEGCVSAIERDWESGQVPSRPVIYRWLLHMFPIVVRDDWERLRQGLAAAGGSVAEEAFGVW